MQPRCDGCGRPKKGKKKPKDPLAARLLQLQKEQEALEAKLTACLMEQASVSKKMEEAGTG